MPEQIDNPYAHLFVDNISGTYDPWIPVSEQQPEGAPIVFMYSEMNKEFSCGHFTLSRAGVPVSHWQPLYPPITK